MRYLLHYIMALTLAACCFMGGWWWRELHPTEAETETRTITVYDTVTVRHAVAVDSVVVRYRSVRLTPTAEDTAPRLMAVEGDTAATVGIPVSQRHYRDTLYEAWVSGYDVALDSVRIISRLTDRVTIKTRSPPRWSIGAQIGLGYCGKFQPYIGVGITYTLIDIR